MVKKAGLSKQVIVFWTVVGAFALSVVSNGAFVWNAYESRRVIAVPDGDSLSLKDGRRVRLLGVDAPERGRCMGEKAEETLRNLTQGKHVRLKNTVTDSYGRVLANVIIEEPAAWLSYLQWFFLSRLGLPAGDKPEAMVNRSLISQGLARFTFAKSPYEETLKAAYQKAREEKLGIFSDTCRTTPPTASCTIKGNIRQGQKRYYPVKRKQYDQVIVDEAFGDRWFCTEKEARSAGFTRASGC